MFDGVVHERQVPGPYPTSQEKVLVVVFFLFLAVVVGGAIAVGVLESKNRTECCGAITNTPNAPKPVPPAAKATAPSGRLSSKTIENGQDYFSRKKRVND